MRLPLYFIILFSCLGSPDRDEPASRNVEGFHQRPARSTTRPATSDDRQPSPVRQVLGRSQKLFSQTPQDLPGGLPSRSSKSR